MINVSQTMHSRVSSVDSITIQSQALNSLSDRRGLEGGTSKLSEEVAVCEA